MARLSRIQIKQYFTKYTTTSTVTVHNPIVSILYFTLVIAAFCMYFASIDFDLRKLYQRECPVQGTTLLMFAKGVASSENISDRPDIPVSYRKKWAAEELFYPTHGGEGETGSFAVVTNMHITENQTRGRCATISWNNGCKHDDDCKKDTFKFTFGVLTGKCIQGSPCNLLGWCPDEGGCEFEGWCPPEGDLAELLSNRPLLLEDVRNFTVNLRSLVKFPKCGDQQGYNSLFGDVLAYDCRYDPVEHLLCPVFRIEDLVNMSNVDFTKAGRYGNVFQIRMIWDCNFDFGWTTSNCNPKYVVSSVNSEFQDTTLWFFSLPEYHADGTRTQRTMYALKFLVSVEGKGRKFHIFTFIINLGASTGLLFVAPFVCDLILSLYEKLGRSGSLTEAEKSKASAVDTTHFDKVTSESTVVPMDDKKY